MFLRSVFWVYSRSRRKKPSVILKRDYKKSLMRCDMNRVMRDMNRLMRDMNRLMRDMNRLTQLFFNRGELPIRTQC